MIRHPSSVAFDSPLGPITVRAGDGAVTHVDWGCWGQTRAEGVLKEAVVQIGEYFSGARKNFNLPLAPTGSEFQQSVWDAILEIPFGRTRTYGMIARELGVPAQSIGQACGRNPIPILIPCHRVLSATGLGGFSAIGGVETKVALLKLEGAASLLV